MLFKNRTQSNEVRKSRKRGATWREKFPDKGSRKSGYNYLRLKVPPAPRAPLPPSLPHSLAPSLACCRPASPGHSPFLCPTNTTTQANTSKHPTCNIQKRRHMSSKLKAPSSKHSTYCARRWRLAASRTRSGRAAADSSLLRPPLTRASPLPRRLCPSAHIKQTRSAYSCRSQ